MIIYYAIIGVGAIVGGIVYGPLFIAWCKDIKKEVIDKEDNKNE
jgi:hypothetical protein